MTQPSKSRKSMYNAPNHIKSSMVGAPLSSDLREKYKVRSIRIRKSDGVKVLRGEYKGVEGKITKIFVGDGKLNVEGVTQEKPCDHSVYDLFFERTIRVKGTEEE